MGEWRYLYLAIDKEGCILDIQLHKKTRLSGSICLYEKVSENILGTNGSQIRQSSGITLCIQKIKGTRINKYTIHYTTGI